MRWFQRGMKIGVPGEKTSKHRRDQALTLLGHVSFDFFFNNSLIALRLDNSAFALGSTGSLSSNLSQYFTQLLLYKDGFETDSSEDESDPVSTLSGSATNSDSSSSFVAASSLSKVILEEWKIQSCTQLKISCMFHRLLYSEALPESLTGW